MAGQDLKFRILGGVYFPYFLNRKRSKVRRNIGTYSIRVWGEIWAYNFTKRNQKWDKMLGEVLGEWRCSILFHWERPKVRHNVARGFREFTMFHTFLTESDQKWDAILCMERCMLLTMLRSIGRLVSYWQYFRCFGIWFHPIHTLNITSKRDWQSQRALCHQ